MQVERALQSNPDARLLQPARQLLHAAVVAACDALDGVKDGLIENPQRCKFDPGVLECRGGAAGWLVPVEGAGRNGAVDVLQRRPSQDEARSSPASRLAASSDGPTSGWTASARATGLDQFRFIVFGDPTWTIDKFNVDTDVARAEEVDKRHRSTHSIPI